VCVSGCFDLLHPGHIRLIEQARTFGKILLVALESDPATGKRLAKADAPNRTSVSRQVTPAAERAEILAALAAVDYVIEFEGQSILELFASLRPDTVVVGGQSQASPAGLIEPTEIERLGCKLVRVPLEPGYSTSLLIDRILELRA
jgi:rfaE bifunctional protein nucleotidyltransferase chain/domain